MKVLLYEGVSAMSYGIKWVTRSRYSHAAFMLDEGSARVARRLWSDRAMADRLRYTHTGAVYEAWEPGGVRCTRGPGDGHSPGTYADVYDFVDPLTASEEEAVLRYVAAQVGTPYDFRNVLLFLPVVRLLGGRPDRRKKMFCSRMVFQACLEAGRILLRNKKAWEVPPDWLQMPTGLYKSGRVVCTVTAPYQVRVDA